MPNRIVHFEIHVTDLEKGKKFYGDVFGWEFVNAGGPTPYWLIMTAPQDSKEPGINGGMLTRNAAKTPPGQSPNAFVCTAQVEDFNEIHERILKAGGKVAMEKIDMSGMGAAMKWLGYYFDLDGNIFGVIQ